MSNRSLAAVLSARGYTPRQFQVLTHIADSCGDEVVVDVLTLAERVELSMDEVEAVIRSIVCRTPDLFRLHRRVEQREDGEILFIAGEVNWAAVARLPHGVAA